MQRMAKRIIASLVTVAGVALGPQSPAAADPIKTSPPPANYLVNRSVGTCATVQAPGSRVALEKCRAHQSVGQGWYRVADEISAAETGDFLALDGGAVSDHAAVRTAAGQRNDHQRWSFDIETGQLSPKGNPQWAVTAADSLLLRPWAGAAEQRWVFADTPEKARVDIVADGSSAASDNASRNELPSAGSQSDWLIVLGIATVITAGLVLLSVRGRRRMLRGAAYW